MGISTVSGLNGQWIPIQTNLAGNLISIGGGIGTSNIVVATTFGVFGASNPYSPWIELVPSDPAQAVVYNHTRFASVAIAPSSGLAVGTDTVADKAVIFKYSGTLTGLQLVYEGEPGTELNDVTLSPEFICVGDNGLFIRSSSVNGPWTVRTPFTEQSLNCISGVSGGIFLGGDSCLYRLLSPNGTPMFQLLGDFIDVSNQSTVAGMAVTSSGVYRNHGAPWYEVNSYDGPITPTRGSFFGSDSRQYIGTTTGILYNNLYTQQVFQHQPSSAGFHVNKVIGSDSEYGYAACNDGWLLYTENRGGPVEPYMHVIAPNGGCIDDLIQFSNWGASNVSWSWWVDGTLAASSTNLGETFNTIGAHSVSLIGTSGDYSDTLIMDFIIVEPPLFTTIAYSVSDTLHCKHGITTITIPNSDQDYRYRLFRYEDDAILSEVFGTGGMISLSSGILNDSCLLGIDVLSAVADCAKRMTDTISVHIEKTTADFSLGLLNAELSEPVHFFNTSVQAATYSWDFGGNASLPTSQLTSPEISFTGLGPTEIKLISTSIDGCIDTLIAQGPFIYNPDLFTDECWTLRVNDPLSLDILPSVEGPVSYMFIKDRTGHSKYITGNMYHADYNSRTGRKGIMRDELEEIFFARYDKHGMLKWKVSSVDQNTWSPYGSRIVPSKSSGDIFVSSPYAIDLLFVDGEQIISPYNVPKPSLFRMDSLGRLVWSGKELERVVDIALDDQDNLYVLEVVPSFENNRLYVSPSGDSTIFDSGIENILMKLNSSGELIWYAMFDYPLLSTYTNDLTRITVDNQNNVIIAGSISQDFTITSADGTANFFDLDNAGLYIEGLIAKFNPDGQLDWAQRYPNLLLTQIVTDEIGNLYVGCFNRFASSTVYPQIGAASVPVEGEQMVFSYNPEGLFRWSAAQSTYTTSCFALEYLNGKIYYAGLSTGGSEGDIIPYSIADATGAFLPEVLAMQQIQAIATWDTSGMNATLNTFQGGTPTPPLHGFNTILYNSTVDLCVDLSTGNDLMVNGQPDEPWVILGGDTIAPTEIDAMIWYHFDEEPCAPPIILDFDEESYNNYQLQVFPNPARDVTTVVLPSNQTTEGSLSLIALDGQIVKSFPRNSNQRQDIDISELAPGVYFLQFISEQDVQLTQKLLIQ